MSRFIISFVRYVSFFHILFIIHIFSIAYLVNVTVCNDHTLAYSLSSTASFPQSW